MFNFGLSLGKTTQRGSGSSGRKALLVFELNWATALTLISARLKGRSLWALGGAGDKVSRWLARILKVRQMDLHDLTEVDPSNADRALLVKRFLDRVELEVGLREQGGKSPTRLIPPESLVFTKSALMKRAESSLKDCYAVELWAKTVKYEHLVICVPSSWELMLLDESDPQVKVRNLGILTFLPRNIARLASPLRSKVDVDPNGTEDDEGELVVPAPVFADANAAETLLVLNYGLAVGAMYSYDYLLSDDPGSSLHPSRVYAVSKVGGSKHPEGIKQGFPQSAAAWRKFMRMRRLAPLLFRIRRQEQLTILVFAEKFLHRVEVYQSWLEKFPRLQRVIFSYDLQAPMELVMASSRLSIPTFAVNERPSAAVNRSQVFAVDTLFTASDFFSDAVRDSTTAVARSCIAVGLWRTDLYFQARSGPLMHSLNSAKNQWRQFVLVLPYSHKPTNRYSDPFATSLPSVKHFLQSIRFVAEQDLSIGYVLRGKTEAWSQDPWLRDVIEQLIGLPNVMISRDYAEMNGGYRLLAVADMVIAKYTSMVDEALAVGVPCVLHDYTGNASGYSRQFAPYLPDFMFARSNEELALKVRSITGDNGEEFLSQWDSQRKEIYGSLNDGDVSRRVRLAIEKTANQDRQCGVLCKESHC